jgi:hypothetical protein
MESSLANNNENKSMFLDHYILQVAQHHLIHSHFEICTKVPWNSLTSMVILPHIG